MVVLGSARGIRAEIAQRGAALAALWTADRNGELANVVLGHRDEAARRQTRSFFGASVGRVAGRIRGARFILDGHAHALASADGRSCLHGGPGGFDTLDWQWLDVGDDFARLQWRSADGDQGFPGALSVTVEYRLAGDAALHVDYTATCDRPTVVNLTHHPFWNLAGEGAGPVAAHRLAVPASRFVELDADLLPTGQLLDVAASPFDLRNARTLGDGLAMTPRHPQLRHAGGYDHYLVLDAPVDGRLRRAAWLHDPHSGRVLEVLSDQPGLQVYTGNFLDGSFHGASGRPYSLHGAVCLEPQGYPDAANQPAFPAITLRPGQVYRNRILYRFSKEPQ